jgi:predicted enzyme related to lactoylglutathione lyase
MDGTYLEVSNESWFAPTKQNPKGEHHIDKGFISYDKSRQLLIFRQFNSEGFINQYVLIDTLSDENTLVFETEAIENFVPGGKARWTIKKISETNIETIFDVSLPGKAYSCFGINKLEKKETDMSDPTPKVTGIGGIFFRSGNPDELKAWYGANLGLAITEWGSAFEFRNAHRPDEINYLSWGTFPEDTKYFDPSQKQFMINYRVQNLEGLIQKLKANGVTIVDDIEEFEYGKFIHIMDPEGNKIELWEPVDRVFTEMGGPTTK